MMKHTPTPWIAGKYSSVVGCPIVSTAGGVIADVLGAPKPDAAEKSRIEANAAFIACACNAYDELKNLLLEGCDLNLATNSEIAEFAANCRAFRNQLNKDELQNG